MIFAFTGSALEVDNTDKKDNTDKRLKYEKSWILAKAPCNDFVCKLQ